MWGNEKIIIRKTAFPYKAKVVYALYELEIDIISGLDELKAILQNPELTVDKLSIQQLIRVA